MKTFLNIRGTNGSGKSTLARALMERLGAKGCKIDLTPDAMGYANPQRTLLACGSYENMAGGFDKIRTFEMQRDAVRHALGIAHESGVVVGEGVLASGVFSSWADFADELVQAGHRVIWAFMRTPVEECLRRIYARNGGKPIKEENVTGKSSGVEKTRQRAHLRRSIISVDLPYLGEADAAEEIVRAAIAEDGPRLEAAIVRWGTRL